MNGANSAKPKLPNLESQKRRAQRKSRRRSARKKLSGIKEMERRNKFLLIPTLRGLF
jgi:ribosomal protein S2